MDSTNLLVGPKAHHLPPAPIEVMHSMGTNSGWEIIIYRFISGSEAWDRINFRKHTPKVSLTNVKCITLRRGTYRPRPRRRRCRRHDAKGKEGRTHKANLFVGFSKHMSSGAPLPLVNLYVHTRIQFTMNICSCGYRRVGRGKQVEVTWEETDKPFLALLAMGGRWNSRWRK